jgi:hypothetical protein
MVFPLAAHFHSIPSILELCLGKRQSIISSGQVKREKGQLASRRWMLARKYEKKKFVLGVNAQEMLNMPPLPASKTFTD